MAEGRRPRTGASCTARPRERPQGGVISPLLSNIYLHYVLDEWFETVVRPRLQGRCTPGPLRRRRGDGVRDHLAAKRVLAVLGKRLSRYGLTLHPAKTRFVDFRSDGLMGGIRRRTGRRSTSSASPMCGDSRGEARTWSGR